MQNRDRILAIDFGTKRIGVAYTDELNISVNKLPYIVNDNSTISKFQRIIEEYRINKLLLGYPYSVIDSDNPIIKEIDRFHDLLKEKTGLEIIKFDESYSTEMAYRVISAVGVKKSKKKAAKDSFSAAVILINYLEKMS